MPDTLANAGSKDVIIEVWQRLARLRSLRFTSTPGAHSRSGWSGRGSAEVRVEPITGDRLRLIESGRFRPDGHTRALAFSNVYLWQRVDDVLQLSHERFGVEQPVFLLSLVSTRPGLMSSQTPHLCGADQYAAELRLTDSGFALDWRITGPVKDECLAYHYSGDTAHHE